MGTNASALGRMIPRRESRSLRHDDEDDEEGDDDDDNSNNTKDARDSIVVIVQNGRTVLEPSSREILVVVGGLAN